jgi:hypothetical protein
MLNDIICLSLGAAFLILLASKLGFREYVQTFGPKRLAELFSCDFCLAFWLAVVLSLAFYIFGGAGERAVLYPFLCTPLIRAIL